MQDTPKLVAEGGTKTIWTAGPGKVLVTTKNFVTGADGVVHGLFRGRAADSTTITCNCFELLEARGTPTHFLRRVDRQTFQARWLNMIPLQLVAHRIAAGSYLKRRPDVAENTVFDEVRVEFLEKDDAGDQPLVILDLASRRTLRYAADKPLSEGFIGEESLDDGRFAYLSGYMILALIKVTEQVFETLEYAWEVQGVKLIDLTIQCGFDVQTGELLVGDAIDGGSWHLEPEVDQLAEATSAFPSKYG